MFWDYFPLAIRDKVPTLCKHSTIGSSARGEMPVADDREMGNYFPFPAMVIFAKSGLRKATLNFSSGKLLSKFQKALSPD